MTINGISLKKEDGYVICYVEDLTDDLKDLIRKELSYICYGKYAVEEDAEEDHQHYSYEKTLKEFLLRFKKQKRKTKKGMMGEFIAHLLVCRFLDNLKPISIFFNKEERSIKKGFDLNFKDANEAAIWYGEVKAGEVTASTDHNNSNKNLLNKAKRGISNYLTGARENLWESVLDDTARSFASNESKEVKRLLKQDLREIKSGTGIKKNAILISVLFHDINSRIDPDAIKTHLTAVTAEGAFSSVILFSIQKSTYEKIEEFLLKETETSS